jgi:hypothetical protein
MDQAPQDPALEARVGRLEVDLHEVRSTLGRLEPLIVSIHAQMPYLATKAELEKLRGDVGAEMERLRGDVGAKIEGVRADLEVKIEGARAESTAIRGDLETKIEQLRGEMRAGFAAMPGFVGMWSVGATLFALAVAASTAGAAYLPVIARALHTIS